MRGSLERLTPVLMTALSAGLALIPLLSGAGEPGREILHPVAVTIFGGFAPLIVTWLIESTQNKLAPAYYVIAAAAISFVALIFMHDRTGKKLA